MLNKYFKAGSMLSNSVQCQSAPVLPNWVSHTVELSLPIRPVSSTLKVNHASMLSSCRLFYRAISARKKTTKSQPFCGTYWDFEGSALKVATNEKHSQFFERQMHWNIKACWVTSAFEYWTASIENNDSVPFYWHLILVQSLILLEDRLWIQPWCLREHQRV